MPRAARTSKISVSVDATVLRGVRRLVRSTRKSLSAHVSETLAADLRRRRLRDVLDDLEREHGPLRPQEMAAARERVRRAERRRPGSRAAA